jgi:hypothetical protein
LAVFAIKYRGHELRKIKNEAKKRGISMQALLRAVVIPEWLERETAGIRKEEPLNENTS